MKPILFRCGVAVFLFVLFVLPSCSASGTSPAILLVGSTPGDGPVKTMLAIPTTATVDFIRWHLSLSGKQSFVLEITYGTSQPNTLGFTGGGEKKVITGSYQMVNNKEHDRFTKVYQFQSDDLSVKFSLVRITENLFHLLTFDNQLMVGNGGWSYSLSRKDPVDAGKILISSPEPDDKSMQLVFDGRTPCQDIAGEHPEMNAAPTCFKLKWRLVLNRDSVTRQPTTCSIRTIVNNQPRDVSGKWQIVHGTAENPGLIIYKIQPDHLAEPILLLVGDENVLFFLNSHYKPFTGNEDFSFAMNKKLND